MNFSEIKGQDKAIKNLRAILAAEKIPSVFLFSGPDGVGKKLAAQIFAQIVLCSQRDKNQSPCEVCPSCLAVQREVHPDFKMVDLSYQANLRDEELSKQRTLRVDTIRHLRSEMSMEPMLGGWKAAVIVDAENLEIESSNALLKILEEPPRKTFWILLSSQAQTLPKTILSRALKIPFAPIPKKLVAKVLEERGIQSASALELCAGSIGRALEFSKRENWPGVLTESPLSAIQACEALPRDLPSSRREAELIFFSLSENLRRFYHQGKISFERFEKAARDISWLKVAVRSNADPRASVLLACLKAQEAGLKT